MAKDPIKSEIQRIEQAEAKLAAQKKKLLESEKKRNELAKKLDTLVKQSGYASPRELVEALVERYNLRLGSKGSRTASGTGRRPRTKMTAALRDKIKKAVKSNSKNQVSKDFSISYAVVNKVVDGAYDKI